MKNRNENDQKNRRSLEDRSRNRYKKRRKKRILNKFLCILLLAVAALCVAGIVYMSRILVQKTNAPSGPSVEGAETAEHEEASESMQDTEGTAAGGTETADTTADTSAEEQADPAASEAEQEQVPDSQSSTAMAGDMIFHGGFQAEANADTVIPPETDVLSTNSVLVDLSTDTILAAKDAESRIYPASMTKILTVLVAAEHVSNPDDTFTMTSDITGYCLTNGCSAAGFVGGETIPVRDLFYGTILPSGGEAAVGLATYVAGSQEAFVELMNQKLEELGLSDTAHFTNCVGLFDENHYCTALDMAMILKAAVENDFCREVLSAHVYTTTLTEQNPEGIILSNWFLRRIEDKDCGGEVLCAKTGFVAQSGDCAASYEVSASGKPYICVTVNTYSSWRCIYDHVAMYQLYAK
ncbi:MAG: serine hydrolase [Eubacteriales bacterium]|nr:serine hydrolase [Eubacteriales bacterium]